MELNKKIIIVMVLIYIYLLFSDLSINIDKLKNTKNSELVDNGYYKSLTKNLQIINYYTRKDILLFMSIAKSYREYINLYYNNYLNKNLWVKNTEGTEIETLVKIGRMTTSYILDFHTEFRYNCKKE